MEVQHELPRVHDEEGTIRHGHEQCGLKDSAMSVGSINSLTRTFSIRCNAEDYEQFSTCFPEFHLEDKVLFLGGEEG